MSKRRLIPGRSPEHVGFNFPANWRWQFDSMLSKSYIVHILTASRDHSSILEKIFVQVQSYTLVLALFLNLIVQWVQTYARRPQPLTAPSTSFEQSNTPILLTARAMQAQVTINPHLQYSVIQSDHLLHLSTRQGRGNMHSRWQPRVFGLDPDVRRKWEWTSRTWVLREYAW